jgi:hemoglobin/transferrin/lactoferrin receptor protein
MRFIGFNADGLMIYQSQNIAEAEIHGVEAKAGVDFGALSDAWAGWSLRGAAAWSRGEDRSDGTPLDSVDPLTATLGLAYDQDTWGAELAGRFVDRKDRVSDPSYYQQGGYGVLDLYAHWNFAPGAKFNVGVFNLADRKYSDAGDVPLVADTSTTLDRYTAPGRTLSASLSVNW